MKRRRRCGCSRGRVADCWRSHLCADRSTAQVNETLHQRTDPFVLVVRQYHADLGTLHVCRDLDKLPGGQFLLNGKLRKERDADLIFYQIFDRGNAPQFDRVVQDDPFLRRQSSNIRRKTHMASLMMNGTGSVCSGVIKSRHAFWTSGAATSTSGYFPKGYDARFSPDPPASS